MSREICIMQFSCIFHGENRTVKFLKRFRSLWTHFSLQVRKGYFFPLQPVCGSGYSFLLCDEFLAREEEEEEVAARKPPKEWRKSMSKWGVMEEYVMACEGTDAVSRRIQIVRGEMQVCGGGPSSSRIWDSETESQSLRVPRVEHLLAGEWEGRAGSEKRVKTKICQHTNLEGEEVQERK